MRSLLGLCALGRVAVADVRVINQRARWTLSPCLGDDCIAPP
jgi:hypothetical protein